MQASALTMFGLSSIYLLQLYMKKGKVTDKIYKRIIIKCAAVGAIASVLSLKAMLINNK